ncbi:peptide/nickel transport system permease protein [Actinopolymorpha cephalotaxi]|uniref:Peptide/nickel transport system permease protein n=1 Tax=Actinopolymorpha cephalotaxi TaxID=504797 RepID=A0A1I2U911_9ACTN|nr:ABC transporter permease [Actinopolymorpha cephalotaxi]NYH86488.1 peptide/nickel transport system permease protein [Actinopolymorpha cephalotaxi]SFG73513.1 peptide/nickel transport system permease protein [Actinopolymorpha cephalotaxi]
MTGYLLRRLVGALVVLLVLSAVVYTIFYLTPGNPALLACGKGCTPEHLKVVEAQMGIDQPVWVQYWHFLQGMLTGRDFSAGPTVDHCPAPCLGYSFQTDEPVLALLLDRLPVTLSLTLGSLVIWLVVGVAAGVVSALRRGRTADRLVTVTTLAGMSAPTFLVGILLLMLLCAYLRWLPFPSYVPLHEDPAAWATNLVLPWVTLAIVQAAVYTRITRTAILETLAEDHIRTGRAYGLTERSIVGRHALRSALTPLVTLVALDLGALLGGAAITESVFGLPGLGQLLVDSVRVVDLPVVVGLTLLSGFFIVLANAVADLLYAVADPRVSLGEDRLGRRGA